MSHLSAELQLAPLATTAAATSSLQTLIQQLTLTGFKLGEIGLKLGLSGGRVAASGVRLVLRVYW